MKRKLNLVSHNMKGMFGIIFCYYITRENDKSGTLSIGLFASGFSYPKFVPLEFLLLHTVFRGKTFMFTNNVVKRGAHNA
mmetsp:Transcript_52774/g.78225  ORF Transcript_52774/g.78225 Transcript_52774/m.78225 type:complete len:80 (-) Transcript_52774:42-281(-)